MLTSLQERCWAVVCAASAVAFLSCGTPSMSGGGGGGSATGGGTASSGGGTAALGGGSSAGGGAGATGGGTGDVSSQIAAVRAAADADAGTVTLAIDGVLVSYLKPIEPDAGASDPAGFFVQSVQAGPALFVAVDPSAVSGGPLKVGDTVSFTVTGVTKNGGVRTATGITGLSKSSSGSPTTGLTQTISAVDFSAAGAVDGYESELITVSGTIMGFEGSSGSGYRGIPLSTAGTPYAADGGFFEQARLPVALQANEDLTAGCTVSIGPTPLWRFNARAQPSAFVLSEVSQVLCPAPNVTFARATSATTALVYFDRNIDSSTIIASDFVVSGTAALGVANAALTSPRQVTIVTDPQVPGALYTAVVTGVKDTRGTVVSSNENSAPFTGWVVPDGGITVDSGVLDSGVADSGVADSGVVDSGVVDSGTVDSGVVDSGIVDAGSGGCQLTHLVISQVKSRGAGGASDEFVELYNPTSTAVTLDNTWTLTVRSSTASTYGTRWTGLGDSLPAHGHYLIGGTYDGGAVAKNGSLSSGITDESSLLLNQSGTAVDGLCYQFPDDAGVPFAFTGYTCEGTPANNLPHDNSASATSDSDVSLERLPGGNLGNCTDTDNNAADFVTQTTPDPHDLASPPVP